MEKKLDLILVGDLMMAGYNKNQDKEEVKILNKYKPKVVLRDIYREGEKVTGDYKLNRDKEGIRIEYKKVTPFIYNEANKIGAEIIKVNPLTMNELVKDSDIAEKILGHINNSEKVMSSIASYHFKNEKEMNELLLKTAKKGIGIGYEIAKLVDDIKPYLSEYLSNEIKKQVDKKYDTPVVAFINDAFLEDVSEKIKEDGINYKKIDLSRYLKTLVR